MYLVLRSLRCSLGAYGNSLMCRSPDLPGLQLIAIPERYRGHVLLQGSPFFTVPRPLLDSVVREVGERRFDSELIEMERALSDVMGDHSTNVGFWRGTPINYALLRPLPLQLNDREVADLAAAVGRTVVQIQQALGAAEERLHWVRNVQRGYCGWLMTNRQFVGEQRSLVCRWNRTLWAAGIPLMGPVVRDASAVPGGVTLATGETGQAVREFEQFFCRWRLDGMAAPSAPNPHGFHLPVSDPRPVLGPMRHGGTALYIPDVFPVPSRDEFRSVLEDALRRSSSTEHLVEWVRIVRSGNPARNQIHRYARLFEIQHYLRVFYQRHPQAMRRCKTRLIVALAGFLRVSDAAVDQDLRHIARRLGRAWYLPEE